MTKLQDFSFTIKDNRLNYLLFQVKNLIKNLLLHTIKSIITCFIFFIMLSMFIWNLQLQTYHFDANNRQIITQFNDIVQVNDLRELLFNYFNN